LLQTPFNTTIIANEATCFMFGANTMFMFLSSFILFRSHPLTMPDIMIVPPESDATITRLRNFLLEMHYFSSFLEPTVSEPCMFFPIQMHRSFNSFPILQYLPGIKQCACLLLEVAVCEDGSKFRIKKHLDNICYESYMPSCTECGRLQFTQCYG